MTKPGTIRWNVVRSKKPDFARDTNAAVACGDCFWSSVIVKLPQFVSIVTEYVFAGSSAVLGAFCPPSGFGFGAATDSQRLPESARGTAFKNLGLALIGAGDVAAAEAPLRAALEQSPPDFRAYCSLSEVYKRTGRLEEAARAAADCRNRAPAEGIAQ